MEDEFNSEAMLDLNDFQGVQRGVPRSQGTEVIQSPFDGESTGRLD
jgi:hypothetical protein